MLIHFRDEKHHGRFFDRFDEEARLFEDRLRSIPMLVESIPWPRISFWQGYRHLQSIPNKYFVLQMVANDTKHAYQMAVVEYASRIPWCAVGTVHYWVPSVEPEAVSDQAALLKTMHELCLRHTSLMSLRVHAYIPGDPALDVAEHILRDCGYKPCKRQTPARTRLIDLRRTIEEVNAQVPSKIRAMLRLRKPEEFRIEELTAREQIPALQSALNDSFHRSTATQFVCDFESLFSTRDKYPESAAVFGMFLSEDWSSPKAFVTGVASAPLFEYKYAGSRSNPQLRKVPFNYILLWRLIEMAKASGAQLFDLGGITEGGGDDPLRGISFFKRRFPGFEMSIGRERLLEIRPMRCRLFSLLRMQLAASQR